MGGYRYRGGFVPVNAGRYFYGDAACVQVWATTTLDPAGYTVGRRVFQAGSRNATWHMHTAGQLVFGEAGRGRLQIQGQPIRELGAGDSAFIPGGTFHWHGATPNENFTMMFITMGESKTSQGEPVTDAVYLGRK